jgi:hypothetical protein
VLEQTVQVTRSLLRWADLPEGRLAGVFLVGGASRIPLVATLLHRELGEAPVVIEQPELVVAEGSILADAALLATGPAAPGPTEELRLESLRRLESETVRTTKPGVRSVDDAETVRAHDPQTGSLRPAVDPWPDAAPEQWTPDPGATVIKEYSPEPPVSPAPVTPAPLAHVDAWNTPPPRTAPAQRRPAPAPKPRRPRRKGRFLRFLQVVISIIVLIAVPVLAMVLAYGYGNGESIVQDARHVFEDIARFLGLWLR